MLRKMFNEAVGIGVDIEQISRFREMDFINDKNFLNRIFTKREIEYSFSKKNFASHLAARFAAKEAAIKALACLGIKKIGLNKIEILNDNNKIPRLHIACLDGLKISPLASLSHDAETAVAVVLLFKYE